MTRALAVGATCAALLSAGASAAAASPARPAPASPPAVNAALSGVSCPTATTCMAVGWLQGPGQGTGADQQQALAEAWDGSAWRVVHVPTPGFPGAGAVLNAVSCGDASHCVAVGDRLISHGGFVADEPLAEAWDGTAWRVAGVPTPGHTGASLDGVTCLSRSDCMAVGSEGTRKHSEESTLAETWNGSAWQPVVTPPPLTPGGTALTGVSCSGPAGCMAVGYAGANYLASTEVTLAELWDGSAWHQTLTPTPDSSGSLTGVACTSARACVAVGSHAANGVTRYTATLGEQWQGRRWQVRPTPNPGQANYAGLDAISCAGPTACMATGGGAAEQGESGLTVAQSWDGAEWHLLASPGPGSYSDELFGVSCASKSACMAVGQSQGAGDEHTLAEAWDGTRWRVVPAPNP